MSKSTSSSKKTAWKGIQKKSSDVTSDRAESIGSQDSQKNSNQKVNRSRSSSIVSDTFEDAVDEDEEDEDDDYFQDEEEDEEEKQRKEVLKMKELAIEQDKKRNQEKSNPIKPQVVQDEPVTKPTRMSIILPALQNHGFSDDDDSSDNESLKDPNEKVEERPPQSTADLVAEIEALEVATAPVAPVTPKSPTTEKPTTYEPIPIERPYKPITPVVEAPANPVQLVVPVEEKKVTMEDVQREIQLTAAAVAAVNAVEIHTETVTQEHKATPEFVSPAAAEEFKAMEEHATDLNGSGDSGISVSRDTTVRSSDDTVQDEEPVNHLAAILPAVQESVRHVKNEEESLPAPSRDQHILPEDRERAKHSREFEYSIEDPIDLDLFRDNVIAIQAIDAKDIPANNLKPREQEEAGTVYIYEPVRDGMKYLFDNKFMKAKAVFQTKASIDPLYALGLGAMAFIKDQTYHESDVEIAMNALATAYTIAKTQIDNTSFKKPFKDTISTYFTTLLSANSTGLPKNPPAMAMPNSSGGISSPNAFTPNGVLRAHVVKAECCLLMGILQMTQESVVGYLKCGLNLRRGMSQ
ncbi:hypothetical protein BDF21DRAFT_441011 [Thamnidium elegans]|nr:hypothetical protein BDF21DRAFT_441011 [Thamnidium elegans]